MKVDIEELIKKRWDFDWSYGNGNIFSCWDSITDKMVDAAVTSGSDEFAVILSPDILKRVKCECKFPSLKKYFVTGIFALWEIDQYNKEMSRHGGLLNYSLITFSKDKPKKIRTCVAPEILEDDNLKYNQRLEYCKKYYRDLESYINTSKVPDSLKSCVHKIFYADYREEIFDARFYSYRFLRISNALKKQKVVFLKDIAEIIDLHKDDNARWSKIIDDPEKTPYPLNEKKLGVWRVFLPIKKGDIVISYEGGVYLFAEDSKMVVSPTGTRAILRLKSTLVTPEYLFLYMNSTTCEDVNYLTKIMLSQTSSLLADWENLGELRVILRESEIPLALDKNESQKYEDMFNQNYRYYLMTEKEIENCDGLEELKDGKLVSDPDANDHIVELMQEVKMSIPNKIYNGAITSIGSILEAFLTGWLGDMDNEDYFRNSIGKSFSYGKERNLDLSFKEAVDRVFKQMTKNGCIPQKIREKAKNIRPKAENIRSMRDCVHARVYLKQKTKFTRSDCESALKDLEEIIRLRYYNFQMDSFMEAIAIE